MHTPTPLIYYSSSIINENNQGTKIGTREKDPSDTFTVTDYTTA